MSSDLEQIITDSVNDSINDVESDTPAVSQDTSPEPVEASTSDSVDEPVAETPSTEEVAPEGATEPVVTKPEEPQDEFAKLVGLPQTGVGGRENRIPYSRVKKITEKAVNDVAEAALGRKLNAGEKAVDVVKAHVAQLPELKTKVTEYESRLEAVGRFEDVMEKDPERFLNMLSRLPAYKEFFEFVSEAYTAKQNQGQAPAQAPSETVATATSQAMPEPDETLADGSKVYSLDGLKSLLDWNGQTVESRVAAKYESKLQEYEKKFKELEDRYNPVVNEWQEQRRIQAALPTIRKQLEDARKLPLFTENEGEILKILQEDKQISLEGAYQKVVFPKLIEERNKVRQDVIKELQTAPQSTSVTSRGGVKPTPVTHSGPRSIEDIIKEQIATLK